MITILETLLLAVLIAVDLILSRWLGQQAYAWMPAQATAEAKQVDDLFSFLVTVGAFIFLGITGVIAYSVLTCRAPKGDFSDGHPARGNWKIEATWTIVPILLVLWIAFQSFRIYELLNIQGLTPVVHLHLMDAPAYAATADNTSKPTEANSTKPTSETIEVIAKQWAWLFRYPGNVTSTELHLPVQQSVRLKLQSEDVLHGFYVPEFRVKQDIIPNRSITFVFTPLREGKYRLRDSQFSGAYFALMDADVYVESPEAYRQWLAQATAQQPAAAENRAFAEYRQHEAATEGKGWKTVVPARPPTVNYFSR